MNLGRRYLEILREAAVDIAADQRAVGTEVGQPLAAVETGAVVGFGIDDDAFAGLDNLPYHFMPRDQRIRDGDRAVEDLVIGAADTAVRDADEHLARRGLGPRDLVEHEVRRRAKHHRLHGILVTSKVEVRSAK
jgi:hypothetical protein